MGHEDALNRIGPDLLRSGGDDVGDAAGNDQLPIGVEPAGIAGGEPVPRPVGPHDPPVVPAPIAAQQHRGADQDLPLGARAGSLRSAERHLDSFQRPAVVNDTGARLGHAVGGDNVGREHVRNPAAAEEDAGEDRGIEAPERGRHQ